MIKMIKRMIGFIVALMFMGVIVAAVYLALDSVGAPDLKPVVQAVENVAGVGREKAVVGPYTVVQKSNYYRFCGDAELYSRGPADKELIGLDLERLKMKYPASENWEVAFQGQVLNITRNIDGYCGLHQAYRHLGIYEGKVAVYQGPLGNDEVLLRLEENIALNLLPADWRERLEKSSAYNSLTPDEKSDLQATIEFPNEEALNVALENFDEMAAETSGVN